MDKSEQADAHKDVAIVFGRDNQLDADEILTTLSSGGVRGTPIRLQELFDSSDSAQSYTFVRATVDHANLVLFMWSRLSPHSDMMVISALARTNRKYLGIVCDEDFVAPYPLNLFANIPWHSPTIREQMLPLLAFSLNLNDIFFDINAGREMASKQSIQRKGLAFISHSDKSSKDVEHLAMCLREAGYRYWGFRHSSRNYAKGTLQEVQDQIDKSSVVLIFLTQDWLESEWCMRELIYAKSIGKPIFLLRMKAIQNSLAFAGETYVDFVDSFPIGFSRLKEELDRLASLW